MKCPECGAELPAPMILECFEKLQLIDIQRGIDEAREAKVWFFDTFEKGGATIDVAVFGCGSQTYAPYFNVIVEMAYNRNIKLMNFVIVDKGDNQTRVIYDCQGCGVTELIKQSEVHPLPKPVGIRRKWMSFHVSLK